MVFVCIYKYIKSRQCRVPPKLENVRRQQSCKILGVICDENIKFDLNANHVAEKANQYLCLITKQQHFGFWCQDISPRRHFTPQTFHLTEISPRFEK